MTQYAYVVSGSEDGVIGVYQNRKRAIVHANAYASMDGEYPVQIAQSENHIAITGENIATVYRFVMR
jgi:hypothetical protein